MPNPQDIYNYAISLGATPQKAILLSSAAGAESSWNPTAVHDNHTGYGLFGHRGDRLANMQAFAGQDRPGWQHQVAFALDELNNSHAGTLADSAKSAAQLTAAQMHFERPRGYSPDNPQNGDNWSGRLNLTNKIMDAVNGAKDWAAVGKGAVANVAGDFGNRLGGDVDSLRAQQQAILKQLMASMQGQGMQAPQPRAGLLGQLLFGPEGLHGMLAKHLPNGILGGAANALGNAFAPSAQAAPMAQPNPAADMPTPPERPMVMANNLPPMWSGDGTQIHNAANQAMLDARTAIPTPPQRPLNLAGNTLPDITIGRPQQMGGLDALQGLFGGMFG